MTVCGMTKFIQLVDRIVKLELGICMQITDRFVVCARNAHTVDRKQLYLLRILCELKSFRDWVYLVSARAPCSHLTIITIENPIFSHEYLLYVLNMSAQGDNRKLKH